MALTFLAPAFLWALVAIPVVVVLHFLRARKRRKEVSALFLWQRAHEVARARRRFSSSWTLIAQILFIVLAALALSRPNLSSEGPPHQVFVVDASASMAARDSDGVRIIKAAREAGKLIHRNSLAAVVRAGLDATVVQPLTGDVRTVEEALFGLTAADREADLVRALGLAKSIAPDAEVHLFSDQPPPPGAPIYYHYVGGDSVNIGISTFDVGIQQAYVAVVSTSPRPQDVVVEISKAGKVIVESRLLIPAGGQATTTLPLTDHNGLFQAKIRVPEWDALSLDDTAYAGREDHVVVLDSWSPQLIRALDAIPGIDWSISRVAETVLDADVRIMTGVDPASLPDGSYVLFPAPSSKAQLHVVRDWDQGDPLLRFVDLREAVVGVDPAWSPGDGSWEVLARTRDLKPVLMKANYPDLRIVRFAFHPSQTDIVFRPAFPALMTNIIREFRSDRKLELGTPLPKGSTLDDTSVGRVEVPGVYVLEGNLHTASLNSGYESRLLTSFEGDYSATSAQAPVSLRTDRAPSVSLWLVFIALLVLGGEWFLWINTGGGRWTSAKPRS
jgi:Ca-activated chloride channel family protein